MKITKFVHSCLLVETEGRTALFDPGEMSAAMLDAHEFVVLDDIIVTHEHFDHFHVPTVQALVAKFPGVRITATIPVVMQLQKLGIAASAEASEGVELFESPHEGHQPMFDPPAQIGVHYLGQLSHPGDSHSFTETKAVLALPIAAPWGSTDRAVQLALELKPQCIIPIHDWHWREEVRMQMYDRLERLFQEQGVTFWKPLDGEPFELES